MQYQPQEQVALPSVIVLTLMISMHIITPELCNFPLQASECCFDIMCLFLFELKHHP